MFKEKERGGEYDDETTGHRDGFEYRYRGFACGRRIRRGL